MKIGRLEIIVRWHRKGLTAEERRLCQEGRTIDAIKAYLARGGVDRAGLSRISLREAKDVVDAYRVKIGTLKA